MKSSYSKNDTLDSRLIRCYFGDDSDTHTPSLNFSVNDGTGNPGTDDGRLVHTTHVSKEQHIQELLGLGMSGRLAVSRLMLLVRLGSLKHKF
jgi:hypothetical protein